MEGAGAADMEGDSEPFWLVAVIARLERAVELP